MMMQHYGITEQLRKCVRLKDFCELMRWNPKNFDYHLNHPLYFEFSIPKKKGGSRNIQAPNEELKQLQKDLNHCLQDLYLSARPVYGFGFVKTDPVTGFRRNIVTNAQVHAGCRHLMNIDLKDFFPNISARMVKDALEHAPFSLHPEVATAIALLGTYARQLPAGAPSSPVLANIVCHTMDRKLFQCSADRSIFYTRYADDLSFSSHNPLSPEFLDEVRSIIQSHGFFINEKKFRLMSSYRRQTVTGLVVNEKVNAPREYRKKVRAMLHSIDTIGPKAAAEKHYDIAFADHNKVMKFINKVNGMKGFLDKLPVSKE